MGEDDKALELGNVTFCSLLWILQRPRRMILNRCEPGKL